MAQITRALLKNRVSYFFPKNALSFSRSASVVFLGSSLAALAELTLLIGLASCAFCSVVNSSFFFPVDFFGCACFRGVPLEASASFSFVDLVLTTDLRFR